jgi:predicted Zn finger-like uncharacterized protein
LNNFNSKINITHNATDARSELNTVCPNCQTKIRISDEQLQNQQTYRCPQCGTINDMEHVRKFVQDAKAGKLPAVQKIAIKISIACPKCNAKISFSDEQLQAIDDYHCPQCGSPIDIEPLKKQIEDDRENAVSRYNTSGVGSEQTHKETYEITSICPKCRTKIPISTEQLQFEQTYACPQCGTVRDMAPLRKAFQEAQESSESGGTSPEPYHIIEKRSVSFGPGMILRIIGIILMVAVIIMVFYRLLNPG